MGIEELQRTMQFLAQQQQALARSSIQSVERIVREHSKRIERLAGHVQQVRQATPSTVRLIEERRRARRKGISPMRREIL